jgi:peptidoglycan/LPS O-acetylase OafA/YrhL
MQPDVTNVPIQHDRRRKTMGKEAVMNTPPASMPDGGLVTGRPKPSQTFEGVQILRGFAAMMVVFHHMCWVITSYHPGHSAIATFHRLAEVGAGGVDIFFCISGLVIAFAARNLPAGIDSARTFAWRRLLRVVPPYWIFTSLLLLLWAVGIGLKGLNVTPGLVVASFLLIPWPKTTVTGAMSYHPILDVGWTLTFEMYFYAICTLVIALVGGRRIWPWTIAALGFVAAISVVTAGPAAVASATLASPLLLEFIAGVLLAHFVAGRTASRVGRVLIALGIVGLIGSIFLPDPMTWRVLCWGIPGTLLVAGAILIPVQLASPFARLLGFLGTASYTIYLVHPFFTLISGTLLKQGIMEQVPPDLLLMALTIAAVAGSAVTWFFVEGPLIRLLKPRSRTAALANRSLGA